ncbi:MAG: AAA family ATPase [Deltaproteobacteria bacterium]|jgi:hypothetical protein|nr:AAA family ATPase [Deltaproteobacteria bacterium]
MEEQPHSQLLDLGLDIVEFVGFKEREAVYVDKTHLIQELITGKRNQFLLTRPRRFGKTVLVSTMEDILLGRRELFENTSISTSGYKWERSHVIRLDMASFDVDADIFEHNLSEKIRGIASRFAINLNNKGAGPLLVELIEQLYDFSNKIPLPLKDTEIFPTIPKVAVLIDEYDFPFFENFYDSIKLGTIRRRIRAFYSALKTSLGKVRFLFLTGVTRFLSLTSSSGLNNLQDLTFAKQYASICGFTEKEIRDNYNDYLVSACDELIGEGILKQGSSVDKLFDMIRDWYDGYSWDGETKIFNPISILNFLQNNEFGRYWYDTGAPEFLEQLQLKNVDYFKAATKNIVYSGKISAYNIRRLLYPQAALFQTGYLTVKSKPIIDQKGKSFTLCIPNGEVRLSFAEDCLIPNLYKDINRVSATDYPDIIALYQDFANAFVSFDAVRAAEILQTVFAKIPHQIHEQTESFYKSHMLPAFFFIDGFLSIEDSSGAGDSDLVLQTRNDDVVFIIEVKYSKYSGSSEDESLRQASEPLDSPGLDVSNMELSLDPVRTDALEACADENSELYAQAQNHKINWEIMKLLEQGERKAFSQIFKKGYHIKHLNLGRKVVAVSVSVVGRIHVKIKFEIIQDNPVPA